MEDNVSEWSNEAREHNWTEEFYDEPVEPVVHNWNTSTPEVESWDSDYPSNSLARYLPAHGFEGPRKYRFLGWLVDTIRASYTDFAQRELKEQLSSSAREEKHLRDNTYNDAMVVKDWNNPETIELKYWPAMLRKAKLPASAYSSQPPNDSSYPSRSMIFDYADILRNAYFDRQFIQIHVVENILLIPAMLKDKERNDQVNKVWRVIRDETSADEQLKGEVEVMLDITKKPCTTYFQAHSRLLALVEEGCFQFAKRRDSSVFNKSDWYEAEDVEVRSWKYVWWGKPPPLQNPNSSTGRFVLGGREITSRALFEAVIEQAVDLRNCVAHSKVLYQTDLCWFSNTAMLLLILFEEWELAIEVELLVETFNTKKPREEVLLRLYDYCDRMELAALQIRERRRRETIRRVRHDLENPSTGHIEESSTHSERIKSPLPEIIVTDPANTDSPNRDSPVITPPTEPTVPSSEICELAIKEYVFSESMHEGLRLGSYN